MVLFNKRMKKRDKGDTQFGSHLQFFFNIRSFLSKIRCARNYLRSKTDSSFNFFTLTKDDSFTFSSTRNCTQQKRTDFFLSITKSVQDFVFFVMRFNVFLFQSIRSPICFLRTVFLRAVILVILPDSILIQIPLGEAELYFGRYRR
jgi:hypothetical protein